MYQKEIKDDLRTLCIRYREHYVCYIMYMIYVVHVLSVTNRYQFNLGEEHWKTVKIILKYIRRTVNLFLIYGNRELKLEGFTNTNF